ncbi:hypothetical protein ACOSQ3_025324 [Xanthoceras sorbifolium]
MRQDSVHVDVPPPNPILHANRNESTVHGDNDLHVPPFSVADSGSRGVVIPSDGLTVDGTQGLFSTPNTRTVKIGSINDLAVEGSISKLPVTDLGQSTKILLVRKSSSRSADMVGVDTRNLQIPISSRSGVQAAGTEGPLERADDSGTILRPESRRKMRAGEKIILDFYQRFWNVVGSKVMEACLRVLNDGHSVADINSTLIVLISKVERAVTIGDFRLISLCNVIYKVVAKALANKMRSVLGKKPNSPINCHPSSPLFHRIIYTFSCAETDDAMMAPYIVYFMHHMIFIFGPAWVLFSLQVKCYIIIMMKVTLLVLFVGFLLISASLQAEAKRLISEEKQKLMMDRRSRLLISKRHNMESETITSNNDDAKDDDVDSEPNESYGKYGNNNGSDSESHHYYPNDKKPKD